jgi:hypothetical protein
LKLDQAIRDLPSGTLTVSVKDKQGNVNRLERAFTISASKPLQSSR